MCGVSILSDFFQFRVTVIREGVEHSSGTEFQASPAEEPELIDVGVRSRTHLTSDHKYFPLY